MTKRNLIIIHRGEEYVRDFDEIAAKVMAIDPSIVVYSMADNFKGEIPSAAWLHPALTVSFSSRFRPTIKRGPILRNGQIDKLAQQEIFRKSAISTPPAMPFRFGMSIDPILFGDLVVLKTRDLSQTSHGEAVQLFRRKRLHEKTADHFAADHPIRRSRNGYIVQRFIDTGPFPSFHRVQTFFGRTLYAWKTTLAKARADLSASDEELETTKISNQGDGEKTRRLINDPDILSLAEKVHCALPSIPILGVDILRDANTGKLYVLECNAGGNTWHFSSGSGERFRLGMGNAELNGRERANEIARRMMIDQFGAFDIAAKRLVELTTDMAQ